MPIYEYQSINSEAKCDYCTNGFEIIQTIHDKPLSSCPKCKNRIKRIISSCHAAIIENSTEDSRIEKKISGYEKAGMWSHAAELADTHSARINDKGLKTRALENYKKAGYSSSILAKHEKNNGD
jgi:putative FmdB family regulatory protein